MPNIQTNNNTLNIQLENLINTFFVNEKSKINNDIILDHFLSIDNTNSNYALLVYCLGKYCLINLNISLPQIVKLENYMQTHYSIYISLFANIGNNFTINNSSYIGGGVTIDDNVSIGSSCVIGKNSLQEEKQILIGSGTTICDYVKIYAPANIGCNVKIADYCLIKDNVDNDCSVEILNELLVKHFKNATLPSQDIKIFGILPKQKDSLLIVGSGFYNPKISIITNQILDIDYSITYWDKSKIIVQFQKLKHKVIPPLKSTIVICSNNKKINILNSFGLEELLSSNYLR